jgi:hypothetical protein
MLANACAKGKKRDVKEKKNWFGDGTLIITQMHVG